jgi:Domain of unknown function (DUF222)/HNH endonuclease
MTDRDDGVVCDAGVDSSRDAEAAASDARHERMDRIAVLYGEITAATREFLRALAESDRCRDWAAEGFTSCADWLAWRIGVTRNTASEKVRAARALEELPLISEAMSRGELSFSKVRALTRAATPESEAELLAFARAASAASLERLVRGWKTLSREDEQKRERLLHRTRSFSVWPDERGMYDVRGKLTPEVAAVLMRAIEAASDALYKECHENCPDEERPDPDQLRADALGLVAEQALAAGFGSVADDPPISGTRAGRYQVVVHVEPETLTAHAEPGMSELEDGTRVTAETSRRIACDSARVEIRHAPDGSVLDVGRRTRIVPPAIRRALEARDRGCRFPGCGLRFTDAHHIEHWADGGETRLENLVLLCRRHHRLVHEDGYRICKDKLGTVVFFAPTGRAFGEAAPAPELAADPLHELVRKNRERGVHLQWWTNLPGSRHDRDVPWAVEAAARDAIQRDVALAHRMTEGEALARDDLDRDIGNAIRTAEAA